MMNINWLFPNFQNHLKTNEKSHELKKNQFCRPVVYNKRDQAD
jgi:hypothetical protein